MNLRALLCRTLQHRESLTQETKTALILYDPRRTHSSLGQFLQSHGPCFVIIKMFLVPRCEHLEGPSAGRIQKGKSLTKLHPHYAREVRIYYAELSDVHLCLETRIHSRRTRYHFWSRSSQFLLFVFVTLETIYALQFSVQRGKHSELLGSDF